MECPPTKIHRRSWDFHYIRILQLSLSQTHTKHTPKSIQTKQNLENVDRRKTYSMQGKIDLRFEYSLAYLSNRNPLRLMWFGTAIILSFIVVLLYFPPTFIYSPMPYHHWNKKGDGCSCAQTTPGRRDYYRLASQGRWSSSKSENECMWVHHLR